MKSLLLPLLCATLLLWPDPSPASQPATAPEQYLAGQCLLHAAAPDNPWALAHGMTGLGKSFAASNGTLAHEVIVSKYLLKGTDPKVGDFGFAQFQKDGTPVEPHPNLITKTLVLSGLPLSQKWKTPHGEVTLAQLVESAKKSFRHVPGAAAYWNEVGWTLDLLSHVQTPKNATFKAGDGVTVDLNKVMDDALTALEQLQADLGEGMDKGALIVPKRKQGIYAHTCGGLHLAQAVLTWARYPEVKKRWGKRFNRQVDILFYRLDSERRQYDAAFSQVPAQYKIAVLVQQLKFYGHFLETMGRLEREKAVKLTKSQRIKVERARTFLFAAIADLQGFKAYESLESLKTSQPQIALDLIGDGCHAVNGLTLTGAKKK